MRTLRGPLAAIAAMASLFLSHHAEANGRTSPSIYSAEWNGSAPGRNLGGDVVAEDQRWLGSGNFTHKPGAWCAWGLSAWLRATGHAPLPNGMASSALAYGPHIAQPRRNVIVVMPHHVGLVEEVRANGLLGIISANWGGRVGRGTISRRQVVAFVAIP